jgi:hypothetical protein
MISRVRWKKVAGTFLVIAVGVALHRSVPLAVAQSAATSSAAKQSLDYEFFKTRVEPVFLKSRSGHARCYACHTHTENIRFHLATLPPGSTFWTEEQSRRHFQIVSSLVVPGNPTSSRLLMHPLAPEAGGDTTNGGVHQGGRQFETQNDPDWKILAEWVRGQKAAGSTTP